MGDKKPLILTEHELFFGDRRLLLATASLCEAHEHLPNLTGAAATASVSLFLLFYPAGPVSPAAALLASGFALLTAIYLLSWTTFTASGQAGEFRYTVWGRPRTLLEFAEAAEEARHERGIELQMRLRTPTRRRRFRP